MKKLKRQKFPIISKIKRKKNKALSNFTHFQKREKTGICTTNPNSTETTTNTA